MRLIDADVLKEKFKEHYDLFVSGYKNEQDMSLADKSRVDEILNSMAEVINAPTVDVLDKIRAEIEQNAYPIVHGVNNHEKGMTLYGILQIIDKHTEGSE